MIDNHDIPDLDTQLSAALERKPSVRIPADFAERVAAHATVQPVRAPRQARSYGRAATLFSAALLLLVMFALAPQMQPAFTSVAFDIELFAVAQFVAIGWWATARRRA